MSVRRRGSRWMVDVTLPNGVRIRRSGYRTRREAEAAERRLHSEYLAGGLPGRPQYTTRFEDVVREYLAWAERVKSPNTVRDERNRAKRLLNAFSGMRMDRITPALVERYKSARAGQVSPRSVNLDLTLLSVIFRYAARHGYASFNPVLSVRRLRHPQKAPRWLSQDEIRRLLDAARESWLYPLIVTALHTGLRRGELLNLRWADVDFETDTITIQPRKGWSTKSYRYRTVGMTPTLREVLLRHRALSRPRHPEEYVFTYHGRPVKSVKTAWSTVARRAGLKHVSLHTLRHTFASHLAMAGVPLTHIQHLLGHRDYSTTLVYAHLSTESVVDAVERLPYSSGHK